MSMIRPEIADKIEDLAQGMALGETFADPEGELLKLVGMTYRHCLEIAKDYSGQGVAIAAAIREHMDLVQERIGSEPEAEPELPE